MRPSYIFRCLVKAVIPITAIILATLPAMAVVSGVTYQGRILKPDGSPLEGSNVQFRMQIRSPGGENCLLYEEQQNLDMRNSKGLFSVTLNDGSGARLDSSGLTIDRIFANRGSLNFGAGACGVGATYTPNEGDGRKLIVQFKDETMGSWEPMPSTNINFVPFALETRQVQGFGSNSLVRVQESDGTMGNVSPLSNAAYTELLALIAGTSTQYVRNGTTAGARVPTYTGNPLSPVAGSIWFDTASNQLKFRDTSGVQTVGTASGSVTSVTAGAGLATTPSGGITSTGSIAIDVGGVVSTMLADGSVITAKIADGAVTDLKLADGAVVTAKLADGSVTSAKIFDGTIVGSDLASNITISTTGSVTASGFTTSGTLTAIAVTAPTVSAGVNVTRQIQLFDPDAGSTNKITFTADSTLSSDYTLTWPLDDGSANQVLMTDGSGKLAWTTITPGTGDFKADGTVPMAGNLRLNDNWLSNDGGAEGIRVDNSGKVGVGTSTPQELLDIDGAIRVGTTTTCGAPNPGTIRYNSGNLEYCNGTAWQVLGVAGAGISALTGDVTASGTGSVAATIANNAVTSAKIADGTIATADVADKAVTFAKIQDIATNKLVGRSTASAGPIEEIAIGTGLSLSSGTLSSNVTGLPGCSDGELALYIGSAWTCISATAANTASTVVRRDSSGNFVAGTATLTSSLVLKDGAAGGQVSIATPVGFTSYSLTLPSDDGNNGQVLTTNGSGALSWSSPATGTGDFKADGSVAMTGNLKLNNNWLSNDGDAEGIRIDNSGNVGIGTTAPGAALGINGDLQFTNAAARTISVADSAAGTPGRSITIQSGGTGVASGPAGGSINLVTGLGGQNSQGGSINLTTAGGSTNSVYGDITMSARNLSFSSPAASSGTVSIVAGSGNTAGGTATFSAGAGGPTLGTGGAVTVSGGNGVWGGGDATFRAGDAASNGSTGGNVTLRGGDSSRSTVSGSYAPGTVTIRGGNSGGTANSANGGAVTISGGGAGVSGATVGGLVTIQGGAAGAVATSIGGSVSIAGATGSTTGVGGAGGSVTIAGGNAGGTGVNNGGDISLTGGAKTSTGTDGNVILAGSRGRVGIGTAAPLELLDIAGAIRVGTTTTCGAPNPGTIRYNSGNLEYCNGTAWQILGIAGSGITALTGDVTASGTGSVASTIANNAVTSAKIADGTIATADVADSAVTSLKIADGTVATADVADKAITFAKVQDMATNKLLGRSTASSGPMEELTVGTGLSLSGGTLSSTLTGLPNCSDGQLALYVGSAWTCVGAVSANTASTVVRRDSSGNFVAGSATLTSSLILKDGAAGGQVSIATPVGFTNYTLTLPADDGNSGQVLVTNGSGVLSWVTGAGDFKADGTVPMTGNLRLNNNYLSNDGGNEGIRIDNSGNVGIGTATPSAPLDVVANYTAGRFESVINGNNTPAQFVAHGTGAGFTNIPYIQLHNDGPNNAGMGVVFTAKDSNPQVIQVAGIEGRMTNNSVGNHAGLLAFGTTSGGSAITERMRITETGRVGIGTSAPSGIFDVAGGTAASGAGLSINLTAQTGGPNSAGGNVNIKAGDTGTGTMDTGNIVLTAGGTGRAGGQLTIGGSTWLGGHTVLQSSDGESNGAPGNLTLTTGVSANNGSGRVNITTGTGFNGTTGSVYIYPGPNGAAAGGNVIIGSDGTTARGRIGIGTGAPEVPFHVVGSNWVSAILESTTENVVNIRGRGRSGLLFTNYGVDGMALIKDGSRINFLANDYINSSPVVMSVGADMKVGIGTTSPSSTLSVEGTEAAAAVDFSVKNLSNTGTSKFLLYNDNNSGWAGMEVYGSNHASTGMRGSTTLTAGKDLYLMNNTGVQNGGTGKMYFMTGGWDTSTQTRMIIDATGKVGIGTTAPSEKLEVSGNVKATSFITTSDARLKEDIALVPGLEAILKLKGVHWAWKDSHKPDMGVLAQDVEKVFPDAVVTDPRTGFKAVKYQALIAPLIESTKELYGISKSNEVRNNTRNEAQDREIASLNAALAAKDEKMKKLERENTEMKARLDKIEQMLNSK